MTVWKRIKHRIAHRFGWNYCTPVIIFDSQNAPMAYGVRCIACEKVRIF